MRPTQVRIGHTIIFRINPWNKLCCVYIWNSPFQNKFHMETADLNTICSSCYT